MPTESHTEAGRFDRRSESSRRFRQSGSVGRREPPIIAAGLADALVGSLNLDFAFVRLCDPKGTAQSRSRGGVHGKHSRNGATHLAVGQFLRKEIIADIGDGEPRRGLVIPLASMPRLVGRRGVQSHRLSQ